VVGGKQQSRKWREFEGVPIFEFRGEAVAATSADVDGFIESCVYCGVLLGEGGDGPHNGLRFQTSRHRQHHLRYFLDRLLAP
jgi:hypothetical protein